MEHRIERGALKTDSNDDITVNSNSKLLRVAMIGSPNSGKSSLLNSLVGERLSIVSSAKHTTRGRVVGNLTRNASQVVFLDTPGTIMTSQNDKGKPTRQLAIIPWNAIRDADMTMLVMDSWRLAYPKDGGKIQLDEDTNWLLSKLKTVKKPTVLVLNKIDCLEDRRVLLKISEIFKSKYKDFSQTFMVSARKGEGVEEVKEFLLNEAKPGNWIYEASQKSCISDVQLVGDLIREKFLWLASSGDLPYFAPYKMKLDVRGWTEAADRKALRLDVSVQFRQSFLASTLTDLL